MRSKKIGCAPVLLVVAVILVANGWIQAAGESGGVYGFAFIWLLLTAALFGLLGIVAPRMSGGVRFAVSLLVPAAVVVVIAYLTVGSRPRE
jgi:hypothetical protein